jgi:hypothetical protein
VQPTGRVRKPDSRAQVSDSPTMARGVLRQ